MLRFITDTTDAMLDYVKDDPVRPEIPREFRVARNRFVIASGEGNQPTAMICVSLHDFVPTAVDDLSTESDQPNTAIFYTIWSYKPGAGALHPPRSRLASARIVASTGSRNDSVFPDPVPEVTIPA